MLKTELYKDYSTNKLWTGNSSFSKKAWVFLLKEIIGGKKLLKNLN